jgi:homoserine/homoserine lactone efflux protein
MDPGLLLAFAAAVTLLLLLPGPNVALIVANSVAHGPRYGLLTVAGTSSAMLLQLAVTAAGLTELFGALGNLFEVLRWVGVAYLLWLGITAWRAPSVDLTRVEAQAKSPRRIYVRALFVSLTNPKTLLFYGAFFPQFIDRNRAPALQFALFAAIFLTLAIVIDGGWALLAARLRSLLPAGGRLRNRLSGGLLIVAGAALAVVRTK